MSDVTFWSLIGLISFAFIAGHYYRKEGLRHIHETETGQPKTYKHKEKTQNCALLMVQFLCAIAAAYSWVELNILQKENKASPSAQIEANKLLALWPKMGLFDFVSGRHRYAYS